MNYRIFYSAILVSTLMYSSYSVELSTCQNISSSGYYNLSGNVNSSNSCFEINVSNVELNCHGNTINFSTTAGGGNSGIDMSGQWNTNITIRNCNLVNHATAKFALRVDYVNNSAFININATTNDSEDNVNVWRSHYNRFSNLRLTQYSDCWDALYLQSGASNNNVTNGYFNATLPGPCGGGGIHLDSAGNNNRIISNTIFAQGVANQRALRLQATPFTTIIGNTVNAPIGYPISLEFGGSSNNTIYDNFFNGSSGVRDNGNGDNNWNTTLSAGTNVLNDNYLGGNYYAIPGGTGFSETCSDSNNNGICDSSYTIPGTAGSIDNYPLIYSTNSVSSQGLFPFINPITFLLILVSIIFLKYK